jgi:hypothetical protein
MSSWISSRILVIYDDADKSDMIPAREQASLGRVGLVLQRIPASTLSIITGWASE